MNYMKLLLLLSSFSLLSCGFDLLNQHPDAKYEEQKDEKLPKDLKGGLACSADGKCPSGYDCVKADYYPNGKCVKCENELMTGENCDQCKNGKSGPKCDIETVNIDDLTWMRTNMYGTTDKNGNAITCYSAGSKENDPNVIEHYGCLYNYFDAMSVCPEGWRLPTKDELAALLKYHGTSLEGESLSAFLRATRWNNGQDGAMLSPLPAGYYSAGEGKDFGVAAHFWSQTLSATDNNAAYYLHIDMNKAEVSTSFVTVAKSVRCVKGKETESGPPKKTCDNPHMGGINCDECLSNFTGKDCNECAIPNMTGENCNVCDHSLGYGADCKAYGSVKDSQQNTYKTVIIGDLEWMAENMAATKDNDGSSLTCYANDNVSDFITTYGCLYTWEDANKVCPEGWYLPTANNMEILRPNGYYDRWATDLKALSWEGGLNTYGFGALPAGYYDNNSYDGIGQKASFWSSNCDSYNCYSLDIGPDENGEKEVVIVDGRSSAQSGRSVRCVRNATNP